MRLQSQNLNSHLSLIDSFISIWISLHVKKNITKANLETKVTIHKSLFIFHDYSVDL